ncbi:MAG: hypothetical protein ABSH40_10350 [Bryobacteraceae bacterium]
MSGSPHDRLATLSAALLHLHKSLLDAERAAYERDVARITSAGQYLQLVLGDPWFAWLREISQFIVLVDEARDADDVPLTTADADRLIGEARALLSPSEDGGGFHRRYYEAMQRDPAAVLAHGTMMRALGQLEA